VFKYGWIDYTFLRIARLQTPWFGLTHMAQEWIGGFQFAVFGILNSDDWFIPLVQTFMSPFNHFPFGFAVDPD